MQTEWQKDPTIFPNQNIRQYHSRKQISLKRIDLFEFPYCFTNPELSEVGEIGKQLVINIISINGIEGITLEPYRFSVTKAELFTWEELEPQIAEIMDKVLNTTESDEA